MSANAANTQVRRPVTPTRPAAPAVARERAVQAPVAGFDDHEDEFRLNLSDIPRMRESLHVDGLKPSLLSRFLDLVVPLKS